MTPGQIDFATGLLIVLVLVAVVAVILHDGRRLSHDRQRRDAMSLTYTPPRCHLDAVCFRCGQPIAAGIEPVGENYDRIRKCWRLVHAGCSLDGAA